MHPIVLGLPAFLFVLPFAVAVGLLQVLRLASRRGISKTRIALVLLAEVPIGLAGAKLFSLWERGGDLAALSFESSAGFRYPGGIAAAVLALPLLHRIAPAKLGVAGVADILAPAAGLIMAVMRLHCLLTGCCTGAVCHHAWCIPFAHGSPPFQQQMIAGLISPSAAMSLPVHPLQIYFLLAALAAAVIAAQWLRRAAYPGQSALVFLAVHETAKGLLEFLRFPPAPLVRNASLLLAFAAWTFLASRRRRAREETR